MSLEKGEISNEITEGHLNTIILDTEEKRILAEENINVVYHCAKSFSNTVLDMDELISISLLGYAKALDSYRTDKNTKFSTYAINCIRNEILYILKKEMRHRVHNESLSKVISVDKNGNNLQLEDILLSMEDSKNQGIEAQLVTTEKNDKLKQIIETELTERERYVICHRFELYGSKLKTQSELAKEMQMSQANISKIEKSVLKKMRKYIDKNDLYY